MKKFLKEYLVYFIVIILVILTRTFLVTPVRVTGSSMDKTLANGEIMLLYKQGEINRFDIVVIDKKVDGNHIIKRVIGMPEDTIKCQNGIVMINGKKIDDKYANGFTSDFKEVKLADDEYFVLGDNRIVSEDSRYFGPVKEKYIKGTTNIILYPFSKIGKVS